MIVMAEIWGLRSFLILLFLAHLVVYLILQYADTSWISCGFVNEVSLERNPPKCLHHKFDNILLVITFNFALYESLPLLLSMYQKVFPNIYVCGPKRSPKFPYVNYLPIHKGYYGYDCVSEAISQHKNYSGYLFLMDDVLLNFWTLNNMDFNRLWEGPKQPIALGRFVPPTKWYWWKSRWGKDKCQRAFNEISHIKTESAESAILATEMLSNLRRNGNGAYRCHRGRSDIFYVPRKFATRFTILSSIFRKHEVFLEIAVPTIFRLLDRTNNFDSLRGYYLPGRVGEEPVTDGRFFWTLYNEDLNFLHPLKLHYGNNSTMSYSILQNWFLVKVARLTDCEAGWK